MKTRIRFVSMCMVLCLLCGMAGGIGMPRSAEGKSSGFRTSYKNMSVGGARFIVKGDRKIIMQKNGRSVTVARKPHLPYSTNGRVLYYTQYNSYEDTKIIKVDLKTLKTTVIERGQSLAMKGVNGNYMYMGNDMEADGVDLYALNLKTHRKQFMRGVVGSVVFKKNTVLTTTNTGDVGNYPIVIFSKDGRNKKKIADGVTGSIRGGHIYYIRYGSGKFKVFRTDLRGNNKTAVSGWLSEFPTKYSAW